MEIARRLKRKFLRNKFIAELDYMLFDPLVNELENISSPLTCAEARKLFDEIVLALLDKDMPFQDMTPHIQGALELIRELPIKKVSLETIADGVYLSQSRFVTLFKQNVGVPFRRYLMWQRLLEAVKQVTSGTSLTEAARESGFADSAHLSRTFKHLSVRDRRSEINQEESRKDMSGPPCFFNLLGDISTAEECFSKKPPGRSADGDLIKKMIRGFAYSRNTPINA